MKKIFVLAFVAMMFAACGYKSVETPLGKNYVKYTAKVDGQILLGARSLDKAEVVIAPELGFTDIQLMYDLFFVAYKDGNWSIFDLKGKPCFQEVFRSVAFGQDSQYLLPKKADGTIYYISEKCSFGPYASIELKTNEQFAFANNGSSYAIISLNNGQALIPGAWKQIVVATDAKGEVGYYVTDSNGVQRYYPDSKTQTKAMTSWALKTLKNEAKANKTPWPADGQCGIVKVKTLR